MLKQKRKIAVTVFSLLLLAGLAASRPALASGLVPCGGYNTTSTNPCTFQDIFTLIARATNFLISVAGIVAIYNIVSAGFWLVVSMGNEESITQHTKALTNAVIGLVIVFMAFVFVNTLVNSIFYSKCKLDLTSPLTYLTINDQCQPTTPVTTTTVPSQ